MKKKFALLVCSILLFNASTSSFATFADHTPQKSSSIIEYELMNNNRFRKVIEREPKQYLYSKNITKEDINQARRTKDWTCFLIGVGSLPLGVVTFVADQIYGGLYYPEHSCHLTAYVVVEKHYNEDRLTGARHLDAVYRNFEFVVVYDNGDRQVFERRVRDK